MPGHRGRRTERTPQEIQNILDSFDEVPFGSTPAPTRTPGPTPTPVPTNTPARVTATDMDGNPAEPKSGPLLTQLMSGGLDLPATAQSLAAQQTSNVEGRVIDNVGTAMHRPAEDSQAFGFGGNIPLVEADPPAGGSTDQSTPSSAREAKMDLMFEITGDPQFEREGVEYQQPLSLGAEKEMAVLLTHNVPKFIQELAVRREASELKAFHEKAGEDFLASSKWLVDNGTVENLESLLERQAIGAERVAASQARIAELDDDNFFPGQKIQEILSAAGIPTDNMENWTPEIWDKSLRMAVQVKHGDVMAPGVAKGVADEIEDLAIEDALTTLGVTPEEPAGPFDPMAATVDGPELEGSSNDVDSLVAGRMLLGRAEALDDQPMAEYKAAGHGGEDGDVGNIPGVKSIYEPTFGNFNGASDWIHFFGQKYKFTEFQNETADREQTGLAAFAAATYAEEISGLRTNSDAEDFLEANNEARANIHRAVRLQMIEDVKAITAATGEDFNLEASDSWWEETISRVIDMSQAPISPRSATGEMQDELYDKVAIWQNTYTSIDLSHTTLDVEEDLPGSDG